MALHLSGMVRPKVAFGSSFYEQKPFLREGEEKRGRKARVARRSGFGWVCFPFLPPKV